MMQREIAVVGGGAAGLTAAIEAAQAGAQVTLIDENERPGGQLFKQIHKFFGSGEHQAGLRGFKIGDNLLTQADEAGVEILLSTVAYGLFIEDRKKKLGLIRGGHTELLQAQIIILASGAIENALAFPGWTLPGVMGAGAAQTLTNIHRVLPGRRVLMVGSGNVGLIVSYQLLQAGAEVVAIVEALPKISGYGVHAAKVRRAGVPILTGHSVIRAEGEEEVERAIVAAVDEAWQPIAGSEKIFAVDTICLAVGFSPLAELARMAGCRFTYLPILGGFVPLHDENMESSLKGIYVAGDLAGIEEASTAMEEGRLAGLAAAQVLGHLPQAEAKERKAEVHRRLTALRLGSFGEQRAKAKEWLEREMQKGQNLPEQGAWAASPRSTSIEQTKEGVEYSGIVSWEELKTSPGYPSEEDLAKGPMVVIECVQDIPCNPCEAACPKGAIVVGEPITNLPRFFADKCDACGLCIPICPGQAIFRVDLTYLETEATVAFPYEFTPLPKKGDIVQAVNRQGEAVCRARVLRVSNPARYDHTAVITLIVPKELAMEVRSMRQLDIRPTYANDEYQKLAKRPSADEDVEEARVRL